MNEDQFMKLFNYTQDQFNLVNQKLDDKASANDMQMALYFLDSIAKIQLYGVFFWYTAPMTKPDLISEFEYEGKMIVEWFDVFDKDKIPDFDWQQVYVIGNINGKVPVVMYENKGDNLPGGKTEPGESLNETILREIEEELNMGVISWEPLGYQRLTRPWGETPTYQFRAYAKLEKLNDFINDPGGSVIGYKLVKLDDLNKFINYGIVGNRLIESSRQFFD